MPGALQHHPDFPSHHVPARHVDVWLPDGYPNSADRYAVLYMHDGQNLFDPRLSYTGVPWGVDETLTALMAAGKVPPTLVVAVWNTPQRRAEYMPERPLYGLSELPQRIRAWLEGNTPRSDAYLRFLVTELKPFIDTTYRTRPERAHTTIMGSSMGGLISLYALCEYRTVFRAAGCLSTHWPVGDGIVIPYAERALPAPGLHRIYFDYGTAELDAEYEPYQRKMDGVMRRLHYRQGVDWVTHRFEGAGHSERAWRERLAIPMAFVLGR